MNIEMQTTLLAGLTRRLTYYVATLYASQLHEGEDYSTMCPAVSICVLDRVMFREVADPHLDFCLWNRRHGLAFGDLLQLHLLELPKYNSKGDDFSVASSLEQWLYFLRFAADFSPQEIAARLPDPIFHEAAGVLQMISQTPRERELYEARLKLQRDEAARLQGAREEGWEVGRQEGRQAGERSGRLIGAVQVLQQVLGIEVSPVEELRAQPEQMLCELAETLQARLREPPSS